MILTVTLNPSIDRTVFIENLAVGDTNRVVRTEIDAGGKGINLSRIVKALGGCTLATGFLGGAVGEIVLSRINDAGVDHRFVHTHDPTRVNVSIEQLGAGGPPTSLNEKGPNVSSSEMSEFMNVARNLSSSLGSGWVCLSGSVPPGVQKSVYRELGELFAAAGWQVALDADGDLLAQGLEAKPHFVKPNQQEVARLLGHPVVTDEEALHAASKLLERLAPGGIAIVSRGAQGAALASEEGVWLGRSPQVEAKSTIGSGDSMIGGFLWALSEGKSISESLRWGLAAGAATATSDGADIGRRSVIELLYREASVERR